MRKIFFVVTILIMVLLSSCSADPNIGGEAIDQYDTQTEISVDSEENGFLISEKTYKYGDDNVLILNVENKTENAYTVVITAKFFDDSGEPVKNLTKVFEGFPKGYKNYFVFSPETAFKSYKYEVKTKLYDKETYADYLSAGTAIKATPIPMGGDLDGNMYDNPRVMLYFNFPLECDYSEESLIYSADFVVFDNKGEIFMIDSLEESSITYSPDGNNVTRAYLYSEDVAWDDFKLPDNLKGDLSGLVAFKKVTTE